MKHRHIFLQNTRTLMLSAIIASIATAASTSTLPLEQAYLQLAQTLAAENKQDEAFPYYKKTIECNPKNQEALQALGTILYKKSEYAQAATYLEQCASADNTNTEVFMQLATAYTALGNTEKATKCQQKAVAAHPTEQGYIQLGDLFSNLGNKAEALDAFDKALALNQKSFETHLHKAQFLQKNSLMQDALTVYDQILILYKNHPQVLLEKAMLLAKMGNTDMSVAIYRQLMPFAPAQKKSSLLYNIGNTYRKGGDLAHARETFEQILAQNPNHAHAILGLAKTCLGQGDYTHGFPLMAQYNQLANQRSARLLTNKDQIPGKKIFIGAEWMLEDMVQLVRYAKLIKDAGGSVIIQTPPQLCALLKTCPHIETVIRCDEILAPAYHAYIPITSLPALFGSTLETVPANVPYFNPPTELVAQWKARVKHDRNFKIGLMWKRNESKTYDLAERMSIPFELLEPLAKMPGISLYCLQNVSEQESTHYAYQNFFTVCGAGFFDDTTGLIELAAFMKNLDLVITLDCCAAHVAGALGVPVWLTLPIHADYRWIQDRTDCPWYPSMRIFRQLQAGNWNPVLEKIIQEVQQLKKTT